MSWEEIKRQTETLLSTVGNLSSIDAVHRWDKEASDMITRLNEATQDLYDQSAEMERDAEKQDSAYRAQGFWFRFTHSNPAVKRRLEAKSRAHSTAEIPPLIEKLEVWIERTPNSVEEAKLAISEFKLAKKELMIEKKEMVAAARNVREAAALKNAKIANSWGSSKSKQFSRSMARMQKERALAGVQNQRNAIEAQITQIDKVVLWMERIIS